MKKRAAISLQKWLVGIAAGVITILMLTIFLVQTYFIGYISELYQTNVEITMAQVFSDIQETFTNMSEAVQKLADDSTMQDYALTSDSGERYRKASEAVKSIVGVATTNLGFDHMLVADSSSAWYQYAGGLSTAATNKLRRLFWDGPELVNTVVTLDGGTFFCTTAQVRQTAGGAAHTVGLVVALTDVEKTRRSLQVYEGYQNISIALHDFDRVFVSMDPAEEGRPVAEMAAFNGQHYVMEETILPGSLGIVVSVPTSAFYPQRTQLVVLFFSVGLVAIVGILLLASFIHTMLVKPFQQVIEGTQQLGSDDWGRRLDETSVGYVNALVHSINGMLSRLEDYSEREFNSMQEIYELEIAQQKAQMYLLRHQIDRHFLYNSLISIRSLSESGETQKAGQVAAGIARLLQYTSSKAEEVNLFDEMEIVQHYVRIQNIRFNNRIAFETDVDDQLCDYKILKLVVQPLVENALIHGLEHKTEGCRLRIRGYLFDGVIYIEVNDNGVGISEEKLAALKRRLLQVDSMDIIDGLEGIALLNVQKRISSAYGSEYGITISSEVGVYTTVMLSLPALLDDQV